MHALGSWEDSKKFENMTSFILKIFALVHLSPIVIFTYKEYFYNICFVTCYFHWTVCQEHLSHQYIAFYNILSNVDAAFLHINVHILPN